MRTIRVRFLFTIALGLILGLCGCSNSVENIKGRFQAVEYIDTLYYDTSEQSAHYDFSLYVMKAKGDDEFANKVNSDIVEILFGYNDISLEESIDLFLKSSMRFFREDITEIKAFNKKENIDIPEFGYTFFLNTRVKDGGKGVVNYIIDQYSYSGGAHGNTLITCRNYYAENGNLITLNDILIPGYSDFLRPVLLEALKKKTESVNVDDLRGKGFLTMNEIFVPDNYIIKSDTLKFIFNQYEIAPYSTGVIELSVPMSELSESWLKKHR